MKRDFSNTAMLFENLLLSALQITLYATTLSPTHTPFLFLLTKPCLGIPAEEPFKSHNNMRGAAAFPQSDRLPPRKNRLPSVNCVSEPRGTNRHRRTLSYLSLSFTVSGCEQLAVPAGPLTSSIVCIYDWKL